MFGSARPRGPLAASPGLARSALLPGLLLAGAVLLPGVATAGGGVEEWRERSIYQIVTDRFSNGDPGNDNALGSYDPADGWRSHGGDWAGIEAKLDYIEGLGARAIWISPAQTNPNGEYHGYAIGDFYGISPQFGGLSALTSLIQAAHARDILVILDVIANHGGDLIDSGDADYPAYRPGGGYALRWKNPAVRQAPPFDDLSVFHDHGHIGDFSDPEQILGELFGLDDFRTEDPTVRADLIDAHQWLVQQTDADGFRIDTVKHVELDFWQEFSPALRAFAQGLGKGEFFQFGEVFDGSSFKNGIYTGTMAGGAFALDATLAYPPYFAARWVFRDGGDVAALSGVLADSVFYDPAAVPLLVHFLDNHDNGRFQGFQSGADRDDAKARTALTWLHSTLGVPAVYYGTEQEFDGGGDPWNREDMWDGQWDFGPSEGDNFDQTAPLYWHLRRLNEIRALRPALTRGSLGHVYAEPFGPGVYAFRRQLSGEATVFAVVNTAEGARTVSLDPGLPGGTMTDVLSGRTVAVPGTSPVQLTMAGLSAALFVSEAPELAPWVEGTWPPHDSVLRSPVAAVRIVFDRPMERAATEAAVSVSPAAPVTLGWADDRTLLVRPDPAWTVGPRIRVEVAASAAATPAAGGKPLGAVFAFEFESAAGGGPIGVPAGYAAHVVPPEDLRDPLSLARGRTGTLLADQVLLGDTGWDRVFAVHDRGFMTTRVDDDSIGRPASLAADAAGGVFAGDLLLADFDRLRRVRLDGAAGGAVQELAALPAGANDWIVEIDRNGGYGGDAFVGRPGAAQVWRIDAAGTVAPFAGGLGTVNGLAFGPVGSFGGAMFTLDGAGSLRAVDAAGVSAVFASGSLLAGARSLAFDEVGSFGGDLFATGTGGRILRIDAAGQVSVFATGFAGFPAGDALTFDGRGDLWIVESDGGGTRRLVKIVPDLPAAATPAPVPASAAGITWAAPNPYEVGIRFAFVVPATAAGQAPVRFAIYDVAGREIAVLADGPRPPGTYEIAWDGRGPDGRRLAAGVRFAKLTVAGREHVRKIVALR